MAAQLAFQLADGGSIPTSPLHVKELRIALARWKDISGVFRAFHYRGSAIGGSIKYAFTLAHPSRPDVILGGGAWGDPRHRDKYASPAGPSLELRRLACTDAVPKNGESFFIGAMIRWLKKHSPYAHLVSYADETYGHKGTIYAASGWKKIGVTSATKVLVHEGREYHPRSLTIDRPYAKKLAAALKEGKAVLRQGKPKSIWVMQIRWVTAQ